MIPNIEKLVLLLLLATPLCSATEQSSLQPSGIELAHQDASVPEVDLVVAVPRSLKQASRESILRMRTNKATRALQPRARVSDTSSPVCTDAGTNTNGLFALYQGLEPTNDPIYHTVAQTNPGSSFACVTQCQDNTGCDFVTYYSPTDSCTQIAYNAGFGGPGMVFIYYATSTITAFKAIDCSAANKQTTFFPTQCCDEYVLP